MLFLNCHVIKATILTVFFLPNFEQGKCLEFIISLTLSLPKPIDSFIDQFTI